MAPPCAPARLQVLHTVADTGTSPQSSPQGCGGEPFHAQRLPAVQGWLKRKFGADIIPMKHN